jgi:tRNA pseudouridine38-40 synthase
LSRYFIEVSYRGTHYSGFQIQHNANTIQAEVEKAFNILFHPSAERATVSFTGSSRTDAGVHALQNFFHFDWKEQFNNDWIYNLNALLPPDISIKSIRQVADEAHCRFDAVSRTYHYGIYNYKNPFLKDTAYFYPYPLDMNLLNEAAALIKTVTDFTSFSKRNTQAKNFHCNVMESRWMVKDELLIYEVKANRFLRGMVRALTATMLKVGRRSITMEKFKEIIETKDCTKAFFNTPAHGLFLKEVAFPPYERGEMKN